MSTYMSFSTVLSRPAGLRAPVPLPPLLRVHVPSSSSLSLRTRSSASSSFLRLWPTAANRTAPYSSTRRHNASISTMPTRGKKRPSASVPSQPAEPHAQQDHNTTTTSPDRQQPQNTSSGLRRSSRRTAAHQVSSGRDKGAGILPNLGNLQKLKDKGVSSEDSAGKMDQEVEGSREGVANAMQGLSEMESSFKRDIKRRKLQVEESVFEPSAARTALFPSRISRQSTDVLQVDQLLLTPERDACDADDQGWEPAMGTEMEAQEDAPEAVERGAKRTPAVNSDYLPLPWKGRLGYACLNTYLRAAKPPVFSSRTCRIASILEHRHPLADPSQPEHATKNRPDKAQKPDIARGQRHVESLGLANARDVIKMLRWNDKYGIKFMRLSSEMFPFASHEEYGYKLAPFASEVLAEAGKVAAELGHRLTTHPGQFTQLGSPRREVVKAAIRDLEYHDELLSLLQLPPQQDRDAVMIMHMGGMFVDAGGKSETLNRFRTNYATLPDRIKRRLVLENDDVTWSVHDLLPVCEELNIPLVLDYHHHNIIFDADKCREGTFDISQPEISERIRRTWTRKGIRQKMHYSESCPGAVTPRDRRKHSPRVATLPPCPPDADLMIEAKDKEQAVFELMLRFKLPGHEKIADMVAHEREDQDRPAPKEKKLKKTSPKKRKTKSKKERDDTAEDEENDEGAEKPEDAPAPGGLTVSAEDFGMGGPEGRVYWPLGCEDWLAPKKREKKVKIISGEA